MTADRYTKIILTVIATCLTYSTAKDLIGMAYAAAPVDVNIAAVNGVGFAPMPVRIVK